ncbi:MAG: hypothetical protein R3E10_14635 [Gemmatimonadota bacterium]
MIETIAGWAQPWADFYADSTLAQLVVTFLHFGGILVAGGLALGADRATLRAARRSDAYQIEHLQELGQIHTPVLTALGVVIVSGLALILADAEALLLSWALWLKLSVFALLLLNGLFLQRAEVRLQIDPTSSWAPLRRAALRSVGLWGLVLLLGALLPLEA